VPRPASPGRVTGPAATSAEWWRQAVVYQVHPRSLAAPAAGPGPATHLGPATHRGTGPTADLRGVIAQISYLASLGIDAVWLSPVDPSALADDGYDFDEMSSGLQAHGIKVIVDVAPSDASNPHPWFSDALAAAPPAPAADRSIFRDGLGQAYTFDLLEAGWDSGEFLTVITDNLAAAQQYGASATWVLSSYDATPRRARAAALLMLALPGSAYLGQGEELGLHRVTDLARSVGLQQHDPDSTLNLYRQALGWRRKLQGAERLEWMPGTSGQVLHFGRPGGWRSVTNFGPRAVPLPPGTVVVASAPLQAGLLPADTTAWITPGG
jgi:glycosidase